MKNLEQNNNIFELDKTYSTTRRVTKQKPVIENNSEDKVKTQLFLPAKPDRKAEGGLRCQGYFKSNEKDKPLISVITVVFNGEKYLEQTIQSVINQTYDNVEYIIIDGGSTDGTLDIIRKYEGMVDYWVSEGDEGISDAFNKGIELCTGEMIGIINADDWYEVDAFKLIINNIGKGDVIYGNQNYWINNSDFETWYPIHSSLPREMTMNHPTVFIGKNMYKKLGSYSSIYKIAMDYELLLRFFKNGVTFIKIDNVITNMRSDGESDSRWYNGYYEEFIIKRNINGRLFLLEFIYFLLKVIRRLVSLLLIKAKLQKTLFWFRKNFSPVKKQKPHEYL
ncbi:glycosyltransferase family 2 protein [Lutibacter sp.]